MMVSHFFSLWLGVIVAGSPCQLKTGKVRSVSDGGIMEMFYNDIYF